LDNVDHLLECLGSLLSRSISRISKVTEFWVYSEDSGGEASSSSCFWYQASR